MLGRAAAGFLLTVLLLLLGCTSLPPAGSGVEGVAATAGAAAASAGRLAQFPGLRCCDVSGLRFWFTGDAFMERAEELIREARDHILIDSFLIVEDDKGRRIMDLLKQKSEQGVRVCLITDSSSGFVPGRTGVPYLAEIGLPVAEYNPMRASRIARLPVFLKRDHRKFWLIDGEIVALGGQNIYGASLNSPEEGGNTDTMVEFRSAAAFRELRDSFVRDWNAYSMDKLTAEAFPAQGGGGAASGGGAGGDCLWLVHQDRLSDRVVGKMFSRLMDEAQRELWLIQSYALPDRSILKRVRELTARGVSVNIFYSSTFHELDKFFYSTGYRMVDLIDAGAHLWEYGSPTSHLHYKGVIVDDRWFTVGSANLNFRSTHLSKEVNILFEGREMGAAMLENLEEIKANSRRITREMAAEYRGLKFLFYYAFLFFGG